MSFGTFISRLVHGAPAHNTLNSRRVEIFFHRSPGWPEDEPRGIKDLDWRVQINGSVVQTGRTGDDGKIEARTSGGRCTLELMSGETVVATYDIHVRTGDYEADDTIVGVQRRLRTLGYQLGHDGTESDGIDGVLGKKTDEAILDFQIDNGLAFDGKAGSNTRDSINDVVGGSAEEDSGDSSADTTEDEDEDEGA